MAKEKRQLNNMFKNTRYKDVNIINSNVSSKLKDLVEDIYGTNTDTTVDMKEFINEISKYNEFGKLIYREGNLKEVANKLLKLAELARTYTLNETEDWLDKLTVNRNMKSLTGYAKEFNKIANEANIIQHRMEDLYENMGFILNKYYDIKDEVLPNYKSQIEEEDSKYQKFFKSALKRWKVKSPKDLNQDEKKRFFNWIDKNWIANSE